MKSNRTLLLFTDSFPFGIHETYLTSEIPLLATYFPKVIIIPGRKQKEQRPVPEGVEVDCALAEARLNGLRRLVSSAIVSAQSRLFYQEVIRCFPMPLHPIGFKRLVSHLEQTMAIYRWLAAYLERTHLNLDETLFYSYWLMQPVAAIALLKQSHPNIKLISRAHGGDVYEERYKPAYLPLRSLLLNGVDRVFTVSESGKVYLSSKYPEVAVRCEVSRLGTRDPHFDTLPSQDWVFRLVSCSHLYPLKRIDLLIEGLALFAQQNPSSIIEWHHLGDGNSRQALETLAREQLPSSVQWFFNGHLSNDQILEFYRTYQIDAFINVSSSEGLPVSIMEAQSCGIPVVATDVGGTSEIVNNVNGVLLSANPSPQEIADALKSLTASSEQTRVKRDQSKQTWYTLSNDKNNYEEFVTRLIELFG